MQLLIIFTAKMLCNSQILPSFSFTTCHTLIHIDGCHCYIYFYCVLTLFFYQASYSDYVYLKPTNSHLIK